jgi:hypothetical protein
MARSTRPVVVAVLDGHGDLGAISIYLCERRSMRRLRCNDSVFDSLGIFYSVVSSSQGGWTWLSSEGRYMGATAYGNNNRQTNRFYTPMRQLFSLQPEGQVYLNRALANWQRDAFHAPYTPELVRILGEPIVRRCGDQKAWTPYCCSRKKARFLRHGVNRCKREKSNDSANGSTRGRRRQEDRLANGRRHLRPLANLSAPPNDR